MKWRRDAAPDGPRRVDEHRARRLRRGRARALRPLQARPDVRLLRRAAVRVCSAARGAFEGALPELRDQAVPRVPARLTRGRARVLQGGDAAAPRLGLACRAPDVPLLPRIRPRGGARGDRRARTRGAAAPRPPHRGRLRRLQARLSRDGLRRRGAGGAGGARSRRRGRRQPRLAGALSPLRPAPGCRSAHPLRRPRAATAGRRRPRPARRGRRGRPDRLPAVRAREPDGRPLRGRDDVDGDLLGADPAHRGGARAGPRRRLRPFAPRPRLRRAPLRQRRALLRERAAAARERGVRDTAPAATERLVRRVRPHPPPAAAPAARRHRPLRRLADPARFRRGARAEGGRARRGRARPSGGRHTGCARGRPAVADARRNPRRDPRGGSDRRRRARPRDRLHGRARPGPGSSGRRAPARGDGRRDERGLLRDAAQGRRGDRRRRRRGARLQRALPRLPRRARHPRGAREPRPPDLRDAGPGGRSRGDGATSRPRRAPPRAGARLVRPRLLRVKGLRSFRAEREIDFADLGLVAVVGDTGAGKSSILEAITYALYNATTWDQRGVKQLISDGATTMSVELDFAVDGHVYRIARSTSRGAYPPPSHQLECLTDPTVPPLDSEDAINAEVARLVGLDWGGFTSAVILPQGRFQTLLQASPADRTEILKGIFRLGELAEAREQARELALGYREPLDDLQAERARLLPDPAATAREARRRRQEAERDERRLRALEAERARQEKAAAREEREVQRAEVAGERLAKANVRPARDLRELEPVLRELESRGAELAVAGQEAQEHETRLAAGLGRAERAGEGEGELARAKAMLERLVAEAPALAAERAELAAARREVSREEAALVRDERSLVGLRREAAAGQKLEDGVLELQAADDVLRRLERQLGNVRTIAERKADAEAVARRRLAGAAERLEPLLRAPAAAHAAHGLEAGEECPICHQELPAGFQPPRAPVVRAAQEAHERAEAAARGAGQARAAADATRAHLEQAVAEAARKRTAARRALD